MELNITKFIKKETSLKDGNKSQKFTERELNVLIYKALKEQLILSGVSQQREQFADLLIWYKYNVGRDNIKNCKELAEEYINL